MTEKSILFLLWVWIVFSTTTVPPGKIVGQVSQPAVVISASVTNGTVPLIVDFSAEVTDPSGGQFPITFDWDFGDGAASTKKNPRHTFTAAGTYTVTLQVTTWKSPKLVAEDTVVINVMENLVLAIAVDILSGNAPLTVNFTPSVTGAVGSVGYQWAFGDGATSTAAGPSHTYAGSGTYTATCTVTDSAIPPRSAQASLEIDVAGGNLAVCTAPGSQEAVQITSDGSGGALIVWQDFRNGSHYDIYAQKLGSDGNLKWTPNGAAVCLVNGDQTNLQVIHDGTAGAIVTWEDYRSGGYPDIYAQRLDKDGNALWTANGIIISTADNTQRVPQIVADGAGGAIITWDSYNGPINSNIYAQRVDKDGHLIWSSEGVGVCITDDIQHTPRITPDGDGGAVIIWSDSRGGGTSDIYAQRVNNEGNLLWNAGGVAVCTASNIQYSYQITSDGSGGAIVTWDDQRNGTTSDIYARRVDSSGKPMWTDNGVAVCVADNYQHYPQITSDGTGGAVITWEDYRSGIYSDIYIQRVDSSGKPLWTDNGVAVCIGDNYQYDPQITSDGSGGAIVTWDDRRNGVTSDIYARRVDSAGKPMWTDNGVAVCVAGSYQYNPQITDDGAGSAIIVWRDRRDSWKTAYDVYAQRVNKEGKLL